MTAQPVVEVKHLWKRYTIGKREPYGRLTESIVNAVTHPIKALREAAAEKPTIWALNSDRNHIPHEGECGPAPGNQSKVYMP